MYSLYAISVKIDHGSTVVLLFCIPQTWFPMDLAASFKGRNEEVTDSVTRWSWECHVCCASRNTRLQDIRVQPLV
jgi:hypothetical protein